jgi:preprotein translocase subunit SecG
MPTVAMKLGVAAADEFADTREAALTIFIALLILLWLVVCIATLALCRAAATADRLDAERKEPRTGPRMSPRSASTARDE